jgi:predicted extracellular nuclease
LLPLVGTAVLVTAAPSAQAVDVNSPVVISEAYGGGGNTGATLTHDFIELYNNSDQDVDPSTWSVQYAGTGDTAAWQRTNLVGVIRAKATFWSKRHEGPAGPRRYLPRTPPAPSRWVAPVAEWHW